MGKNVSANSSATPSTTHQRPAASSSSGVSAVLAFSHASIIWSFQVK